MAGFYTGRTGALFLNKLVNGTNISFPPFPAAPDPTNDNLKILKLRDWSLETTLELLETTTVDTAVKSYTPGSVSATGSATVLYYRTQTGDTGLQFTDLLGRIMKTESTGVQASDKVGMILRAGTAGGTNNDIKDDISFNAFITNASIQVSTGELTSVGIQFTVDGAFLEIVDA